MKQKNVNKVRKQDDLWGINFYPEMEDDDFIEYDSLINIRPGQGNRSRGVENEKIRELIKKIAGEWIDDRQYT